MVKKFHKIQGIDITDIPGQYRLAYALTTGEDFYDVGEWIVDRDYTGSQILFYDLLNGDVFAPFPKKTNVVYGAPVYFKNNYYFLQCDFNIGFVILIRYLPGKILEEVKRFETKKLDLYNLELMGEPPHVVSQTVGEKFVSYYPEQISLSLDTPNDCVVHMEDGKIFISRWVEEGDSDSPDYKYYDRTVVKTYDGKDISDEIGSLRQMQDGSWWIS